MTAIYIRIFTTWDPRIKHIQGYLNNSIATKAAKTSKAVHPKVMKFGIWNFTHLYQIVYLHVDLVCNQ